MPREWAKSSMRFPIREWAGTLEVNWFAAGLHRRRIIRKRVQPKVARTSLTSSSICLKELREFRCWIRLIIKTEMLTEHRMGELLDECNQLCNIIARSIVTAKEKRKKRSVTGGSAPLP